MSFIHYKLITNQNYEKVTFDGVSLSVGELKKIIIEKKFRKNGTSSSSPSLAGNTFVSNRKSNDIDLEVTNVDSSEVYKHDSDLIPKNTYVQINRVVRNIGPAISSIKVTTTHKENELMEDMRMKQKQYQEKIQQRIEETPAKNHIHTNGLGKLAEHISINTNLDLPESKSKSKLPSPVDISIYNDLMNDEADLPTTYENKMPSDFSNDLLGFGDSLNLIQTQSPTSQPSNQSQREQQIPSSELLCPFEDKETMQRHLIHKAVLVSCCGYFICCEDCINEKLAKIPFIECPHEGCLQEITSSHRCIPHKPIRQKVHEYIASQTTALNVISDQIKTQFSMSYLEDPSEKTSTTAAASAAIATNLNRPAKSSSPVNTSDAKVEQQEIVAAKSNSISPQGRQFNFIKNLRVNRTSHSSNLNQLNSNNSIISNNNHIQFVQEPLTEQVMTKSESEEKEDTSETITPHSRSRSSSSSSSSGSSKSSCSNSFVSSRSSSNSSEISRSSGDSKVSSRSKDSSSERLSLPRTPSPIAENNKEPASKNNEDLLNSAYKEKTSLESTLTENSPSHPGLNAIPINLDLQQQQQQHQQQPHQPDANYYFNQMNGQFMAGQTINNGMYQQPPMMDGQYGTNGQFMPGQMGYIQNTRPQFHQIPGQYYLSNQVAGIYDSNYPIQAHQPPASAFIQGQPPNMPYFGQQIIPFNQSFPVRANNGYHMQQQPPFQTVNNYPIQQPWNSSAIPPQHNPMMNNNNNMSMRHGYHKNHNGSHRTHNNRFHNNNNKNYAYQSRNNVVVTSHSPINSNKSNENDGNIRRSRSRSYSSWNRTEKYSSNKRRRSRTRSRSRSPSERQLYSRGDRNRERHHDSKRGKHSRSRSGSRNRSRRGNNNYHKSDRYHRSKYSRSRSRNRSHSIEYKSNNKAEELKEVCLSSETFPREPNGSNGKRERVRSRDGSRTRSRDRESKRQRDDRSKETGVSNDRDKTSMVINSGSEKNEKKKETTNEKFMRKDELSSESAAAASNNLSSAKSINFVQNDKTYHKLQNALFKKAKSTNRNQNGYNSFSVNKNDSTLKEAVEEESQNGLINISPAESPTPSETGLNNENADSNNQKKFVFMFKTENLNETEEKPKQNNASKSSTYKIEKQQNQAAESSFSIESKSLQQDYYSFPSSSTSNLSTFKVTVLKDENRIVSPLKLAPGSSSKISFSAESSPSSSPVKKSKRSVHLKAESIKTNPTNNKPSLVQQLSSISSIRQKPSEELLENSKKNEIVVKVNVENLIYSSESVEHLNANDELELGNGDVLDIMINDKDNFNSLI